MNPPKSSARKLEYNRERYRLNREAILKQQRRYRLNKKLQGVLKRYWTALLKKFTVRQL